MDLPTYRVVMCLMGQKPRLLATLFSDRRLAEACCREMQKHIPSAQFGVKVFGAIALVMLSTGCGNVQQAVANAIGNPPAPASEQTIAYASPVRLTVAQAKALMASYSLPQPDYAIKSLMLRGELPAPNEVSADVDVYELQMGPDVDLRVQESRKLVIWYRPAGAGAEAYAWNIQ